ncbi:MAG: hypothetical protein K0Q87_2918 [Neobacillus sp.]|jgi:hypothetical protein|nr:hypothetical protein [Neobacillus sp.]
MRDCCYYLILQTAVVVTFDSRIRGPLRIPAGGAAAADASSACRQLCIIRLTKKKTAFSSLIDRVAPLCAFCNGYHSMAGRPLLAAFRCRCTLLIRSRSATAALRVVSCRTAVHSLGRGGRPEYSLTLAPGLPGERGTPVGPARCAGPRQDTPAGPPAKLPDDPAGRPAGRRERKQSINSLGQRGNQPLHRATCRHSPGREVATVRSLPRPRPSRPVDTKIMCPLSVLPSPRAPHPS